MDKNTIVGIILVFVVLIGFSYFNQPSQEEIAAAKKRQDSISLVVSQQKQQSEEESQKISEQKAKQLVLSNKETADVSEKNDNRYGLFTPLSKGEEKYITLENNLMKIKISNKGGKIVSVEIKNFKTYDSLPLILFKGKENVFGLNFFSDNKSIKTDNFYFFPSVNTDLVEADGPKVKFGKEGNEEYNKKNGGETKSLAMRLNTGENQYLEYKYTLKHNSYMIGFKVNMVGMENVISSSRGYVDFNWEQTAPRLERKSKYGEDRYTNVTYKYLGDDVDKLSSSKSSEKTLQTKIKWISFKHLFFNTTIIADESFPNADIKYDYDETSDSILGRFYADITLPYNNGNEQSFGMKFYFGPNHYSTLKQYNLSMDRLIDLGYSILRPVNRYLIIPVFNLLRTHIANFGIIILLLTLFIKLILFPFTFKSYQSQAKMRILKPEIDAINEKFGKGQEKGVAKQQATMALYKRAGVNPMGGCLPMILQMPILFAMFFFFPTSIELRGQSFLWATDLSSYDSIMNLPFNIPMYGDHVSLFCLLMTITTIISTKISSASSGGSQSVPGMKMMMYFMPLMFLFILNSYPAGLSYYYFLANVITIGQMILSRKLIDEDKIREKLNSNKNKPMKKSKFQLRMEKMAKQRGVQMPKK